MHHPPHGGTVPKGTIPFSLAQRGIKSESLSSAYSFFFDRSQRCEIFYPDAAFGSHRYGSEIC